ncbi:MAG: GAF domain-containing protein [Microbacterium sp.]
MNGDDLSSFHGAPSDGDSAGVESLARARRFLATQGRLLNLINANQSVVDGLDLTHVLRQIVEAAISLVHAQYGALGVVGPDGRFERFIHVGMTPELIDEIGPLPEGHGILGAVIDSGAPIRLEDLAADPRSAGFPAHHPPMRSFLGVPIRVHGESFGNLYLTNHAGGPFTQEDEDLVTALATTAGIAIDNARMYGEVQRRHRLGAALGELTAALLAPDAGDVFDLVAEGIGTVMDVQLITVFTPLTSGHLHAQTARGRGAEDVLGHVLAIDSRIARAVDGGRIISGHSEDELPFGDDLTGGSTIAVPLIVSDALAGVLCVTRGAGLSPFRDVDLALVSEYAVRACLIIALAWARTDQQRLDVIEDRARIARDLHDNVIQRLFGTGLGLQALASADPVHARTLDTIITDVDAAIDDIRTAIFALRSRFAAESSRHRLLDIVTEFSDFLRTPPRMTFSGPVDMVLVGSIAEDVFAVAREGLSNVARHAEAAVIVIDVAVTDAEITITIEDDGVGVPERIQLASGTANLEQRAQARGGAFTLERREPRGTRALWRVPVPAPTSRATR